jgi:hypothetical protein
VLIDDGVPVLYSDTGLFHQPMKAFSPAKSLRHSLITVVRSRTRETVSVSRPRIDKSTITSKARSAAPPIINHIGSTPATFRTGCTSVRVVVVADWREVLCEPLLCVVAGAPDESLCAITGIAAGTKRSAITGRTLLRAENPGNFMTKRSPYVIFI